MSVYELSNVISAFADAGMFSYSLRHFWNTEKIFVPMRMQ